MSKDDNKTSTTTEETTSTPGSEDSTNADPLEDLYETVASCSAFEHPMANSETARSSLEQVAENQRQMAETAQEYMESSGVQKMTETALSPEYQQTLAKSTVQEVIEIFHESSATTAFHRLTSGPEDAIAEVQQLTIQNQNTLRDAIETLHESSATTAFHRLTSGPDDAIAAFQQPAIQNQNVLQEIVADVASSVVSANLATPTMSSVSQAGTVSTASSSTAYAQTESISTTDTAAVRSTQTSTNQTSTRQPGSLSRGPYPISLKLYQLQLCAQLCRRYASKISDDEQEIVCITAVATCYIGIYLQMSPWKAIDYMFTHVYVGVHIALWLLRDEEYRE